MSACCSAGQDATNSCFGSWQGSESSWSPSSLSNGHRRRRRRSTFDDERECDLIDATRNDDTGRLLSVALRFFLSFVLCAACVLLRSAVSRIRYPMPRTSPGKKTRIALQKTEMRFAAAVKWKEARSYWLGEQYFRAPLLPEVSAKFPIAHSEI